MFEFLRTRLPSMLEEETDRLLDCALMAARSASTLAEDWEA